MRIASSSCFSGCRNGRTTWVRELVWLLPRRSLSSTAAGSGSSRDLARDRRFISLYPSKEVVDMRNGNNVKAIDILLVEDNPGDVRLTVESMKEWKIKNVLHIVRDGE